MTTDHGTPFGERSDMWQVYLMLANERQSVGRRHLAGLIDRDEGEAVFAVVRGLEAEAVLRRGRARPRARADARARAAAGAPRPRRPPASLHRPRAPLPGTRRHARARRAGARHVSVRAARGHRPGGGRRRTPDRDQRRDRAAVALLRRRVPLPQPAAPAFAADRATTSCTLSPGAAASPGRGFCSRIVPGVPSA